MGYQRPDAGSSEGHPSSLVKVINVQMQKTLHAGEGKGQLIQAIRHTAA